MRQINYIMKPDLVIIAHGSRREQSNQEVRDLAAKIQAISKHQYQTVNAGFLELAEPLIPQAIENCILKGSLEIHVFPYFLSAGRHVTKDVPNDVNIIQQKYPDIKIIMKDYLGSNEQLPQLILKQLL